MTASDEHGRGSGRGTGGPVVETALRWGGWALLGAGVLLAAFVFFQLVVTSAIAEEGQADLSAELDRRIATVEVETIPYVPAGSVQSAVRFPDEVDLPPPRDEEIRAAAGSSGDRGYLADAGSLVVEPPAPHGDALGRIEIPSVGIRWTVVEGVRPADLRTGAGHMPDTAMPGQPGNAVISGHRTTYGAPFGDLGETDPGDLITVTTATGAHVYQIVQTRIVRPHEMWVADQWEGSWLTLTTCHPKHSSRRRLVVFARLVGGPNAPTLLAEM